MWSGTDGAAPAPGRVCQKVMWKWNVAELDACQRLLESRKIIFLKNKVKTVRHLWRDYSSRFQYAPGYLNNWVFWIHVTCSSPRGRDRSAACCFKKTSERRNERPGPFCTLHYWTNNYPAITVELFEIEGECITQQGSWQRELTQQATCKIGK